MRHPQYCLAHHPGVSSIIINATHFSTQPTLAHNRLTHADTSSTLARQSR